LARLRQSSTPTDQNHPLDQALLCLSVVFIVRDFIWRLVRSSLTCGLTP
jgi:hypothetical protein